MNDFTVSQDPHHQTWAAVVEVSGGVEHGASPRPYLIVPSRTIFWSLNPQAKPMRHEVTVRLVFQGASVVDEVRPLLKVGTVFSVRGSLVDLGVFTANFHSGLAIHVGSLSRVGARS